MEDSRGGGQKRKAPLDSEDVEQIIEQLQAHKRRKSSDSYTTSTRAEVAAIVSKDAVMFEAKTTQYESWKGWGNLRAACSNAKTEHDLQTAFTTFASSWKGESGLSWKDTSTGTAMEGRRPDLSCVRRDTVPHEGTILAVLELKAPDVKVDCFDSVGEVVKKVVRYLKHQRLRHKFCGMVFNGKAAVSLYAVREEETIRVHQSHTVEDERAWELVRSFIESSSDDLGMLPPVKIGGHEYTVLGFRGRGGSCSVYSVEDIDGMVENGLIKIYTDERVREKEEATLRFLASQESIATRVTKVVASEGKYLVVTPRAHHFTAGTFCFEHAERIMEVLKHVHHQGIVHRDVRPANFFRVETSDRPEVLVNDWTNSALTTDHCVYAGAPGGYKAPWIPQDGGKYQPSPKDDLYSFIVSCHEVRTRGGTPKELNRTEGWRNALQLTAGPDDSQCHDNLLQMLRTHLPSLATDHL